MAVLDQIEDYISAQPEPKREDMRALHRLILRTASGCRLWFLDGRDEARKIVSNPNIGYGAQTLRQAGGRSREFYRVGLSANTSGISVYLMGIEDKGWLARTYGGRLGKAKVTGYCVRFRALADIDLDTFEDMIRFGLNGEDAPS
ncbi:MAG: DUF1801 domain-containing protein [Allosphingosinicella sp.]